MTQMGKRRKAAGPESVTWRETLSANRFGREKPPKFKPILPLANRTLNLYRNKHERRLDCRPLAPLPSQALRPGRCIVAPRLPPAARHSPHLQHLRQHSCQPRHTRHLQHLREHIYPPRHSRHLQHFQTHCCHPQHPPHLRHLHTHSCSPPSNRLWPSLLPSLTHSCNSREAIRGQCLMHRWQPGGPSRCGLATTRSCIQDSWPQPFWPAPFGQKFCLSDGHSVTCHPGLTDLAGQSQPLSESR
jgi:hypothetical protein